MVARSSLESYFQALGPYIRRIPIINNKYSQNFLPITENQRIQRLKYQDQRTKNTKTKNYVKLIENWKIQDWKINFSNLNKQSNFSKKTKNVSKQWTIEKFNIEEISSADWNFL